MISTAFEHDAFEVGIMPDKSFPCGCFYVRALNVNSEVALETEKMIISDQSFFIIFFFHGSSFLFLANVESKCFYHDVREPHFLVFFGIGDQFVHEFDEFDRGRERRADANFVAEVVSVVPADTRRCVCAVVESRRDDAGVGLIREPVVDVFVFDSSHIRIDQDDVVVEIDVWHLSVRDDGRGGAEIVPVSENGPHTDDGVFVVIYDEYIHRFLLRYPHQLFEAGHFVFKNHGQFVRLFHYLLLV